MPVRTIVLPSNTVEAHKKWLEIIKDVQINAAEDVNLQEKAARGLRLKERRLPPEVLGRIYAQYCSLINRMYDAYLNNLQLQRECYIKELISIVLRRLYELRNELVHLILNDYVFVDSALIQLRKTPLDIQIVVPYHLPLKSQKDTLENMLQKMWVDADRRKRFPLKEKKPMPEPQTILDDEADFLSLAPELEVEEEEEKTPVPSVHTIIPEDFVQALVIQRHERFRKFFIDDFISRCRNRRRFMVNRPLDVSKKIKIRAANCIQKVYRHYMKLKRRRVVDLKRDVLLGLIPDAFKKTLNLEDENNKIYERRRRIRHKLYESYMNDLENEKERILFYKKDNQIDDITDQIRDWFAEWYYGYGYFPEFPYDVEGGTILVIRGDYPTIEERKEADEKYLAATKGKTKDQVFAQLNVVRVLHLRRWFSADTFDDDDEGAIVQLTVQIPDVLNKKQLKEEKDREAYDKLLKEEALRDQRKKEAENLFKARCNPMSDPGYQVKHSEVDVIEVLQKYQAAWSIYDRMPSKDCAETIYGYMMPMLTEELMYQIHKDCRMFVDELMRLDLKLLIKSQQSMYKNVGWKYAKQKRRKMPKVPNEFIPLDVNDEVLKSLEPLFDLQIITKPTTKLKDVYGDISYCAYDYNIKDPDASFPSPGYGDVKRRLLFSCIFGCGVQEGASKNKAVMLLGPPRHGKSFLVDAVVGEMNAIKIDISPETFSGKVPKVGKVLPKVLLAARAFQPAVIYFRNVERIFYKKVPPEERRLKPKAIKRGLVKLLKQIAPDDKIIFIGTCSNPWAGRTRPLSRLFNEVILVPRLDYGSIRQVFYDELQRIRSMPRDYCVQPLAKMLQGYGFGFVIELFHNVMSAERIVRLNSTPLSPIEFMDSLINNEIEPVTLEEYNKYTQWWLQCSPLKTEREQYVVINTVRAAIYKKFAEKPEENSQ